MKIDNARIFTYTTDAEMTDETARQLLNKLFEAAKTFLIDKALITDTTKHHISHTKALPTVTNPYLT